MRRDKPTRDTWCDAWCLLQYPAPCRTERIASSSGNTPTSLRYDISPTFDAHPESGNRGVGQRQRRVSPIWRHRRNRPRIRWENSHSARRWVRWCSFLLRIRLERCWTFQGHNGCKEWRISPARRCPRGGRWFRPVSGTALTIIVPRNRQTKIDIKTHRIHDKTQLKTHSQTF